MWNDVAAISVPTMLVVGGDSVFVLPEDIAEFAEAPRGGPDRDRGRGGLRRAERSTGGVGRLLQDFVGLG